jgi:hypothetical protein
MNTPTLDRRMNKLNLSYVNLLEALLCARESTCNEIGGGGGRLEEICKTHEDKNTYIFAGNHEGKDHFEDLSEYGDNIKMILKKQRVV